MKFRNARKYEVRITLEQLHRDGKTWELVSYPSGNEKLGKFIRTETREAKVIQYYKSKDNVQSRIIFELFA